MSRRRGVSDDGYVAARRFERDHEARESDEPFDARTLELAAERIKARRQPMAGELVYDDRHPVRAMLEDWRRFKYGRTLTVAHAEQSGRRRRVVWRPPPLHPGQFAALRELQNPDVRFVDITCGTKWGKTVFAAIWLASKAWEGTPGRLRWVAPIYKQTAIGIRTMKQLVGPHGVEFVGSRGDAEGRFPSGSTIEFRSGEDPDSLAGEGVSAMVIDEAGRCKADVWGICRTTLTATRGKALRVGTPKGRNWFWREWLKGQDPKSNRANRSFRGPTWGNPFIHPDEIEQARKDIPELLFRQEYGAEFVDDADIAFPNYEAVLSSKLAANGKIVGGTWRLNLNLRPGELPRGDFVAGVDLGKTSSWTVFAIFDRDSKRLVYLDRFHRMSWPDTRARVIRALAEFAAEARIDSTGVGDPFVDELHRELRAHPGVLKRIRPFKFTNDSKRQIVDALQVLIEKEEIRIPDLPQVRAELQAFEYEYDHATRRVKFAAPEGVHDDIVDALCLAAPSLRRRRLVPSDGGPY